MNTICDYFSHRYYRGAFLLWCDIFGANSPTWKHWHKLPGEWTEIHGKCWTFVCCVFGLLLETEGYLWTRYHSFKQTNKQQEQQFLLFACFIWDNLNSIIIWLGYISCIIISMLSYLLLNTFMIKDVCLKAVYQIPVFQRTILNCLVKCWASIHESCFLCCNASGKGKDK